MDKFFGVEDESNKNRTPLVINYQQKPQKLKESPFSQMGQNLIKVSNNQTIFNNNEIKNNPNNNNLQNNRYAFLSNPPNQNSKFVSAIMDQNREKIRSHENKVQFFFEKNIEDYAKPLQKQEPQLKQSYYDYRIK